MLTRVYLPQILTAFFGGLFVFLGVLTFGNSYFFDRLFMAILIFAVCVCFKNINVVSVLAIIIIQRCIEELAWQGLQDAFAMKNLLYCLALAIIFYLRFDPMAKLAASVMFLVIMAELYWYVSDYHAPEIYWHVALLVINLFSRYMIFSRLSLVDRYFPGQGRSTNLDWIIYRVMGTAILVQALMLVEYLLRHLFNMDRLMLFYHAYPYLMHAIAVFAVWATFNESYRQLLPRLLRA